MSDELGLPMELYETRDAEHSEHNSSGERKWLCRWEDVDESWAPKIKRSKFSDGTELEGQGLWYDRLICSRIRIKGVGAGRTVAGLPQPLPFDCAILTVSYTDANGYDTTPRERFVGSSRVLEVGQGRFWPDGSPCDVPIYKVIGGAVWEVDRYFVHYPLRRLSLLNKVGCVNKQLWQGFPKETLRYDFPVIEKIWDDAIGNYMDHVVFTFAYNPDGWNFFPFNGGLARPWPIVYPLTDFTPMLGGSWT